MLWCETVMAQARKSRAGAKSQTRTKKPTRAATTLSKATTIPQNRLRNESGEVLRRAERGERFVVTVNGRPAAELGPLPGARRPAPAETLRELLAKTPPDAIWLSELLEMRTEDEDASTDPWA
jgi:prevent-host-death family protein